MTNRIIVPANYNFELSIKLDTANGQSELHIRNTSGKQISMVQIAGLLSEHLTHILAELIKTGKVKQTPLEVPPDEKVVQ